MIAQTNRTILFDLVNPEVKSFFNHMAEVPENVKSLTDEQVESINQALLVDGFDDFLRKFKPTIYGYFDENNRPRHSIKRPVGIPDMFIKETVMDRNNPILKMFTTMMDRKRSSNTVNVSFDYEKVTEMLAPEKALREMQKIKMDIRALEERNAKLESDSPAKADAVRTLLAKYESTRKYYSETGAQLNLMVGMLKENLIAMEKAGEAGEEYKPPALPVLEGGELTSLKPTDEYLKLAAQSGGGVKTELIAADGKPAPIKDVESYQQYTITTMERYYDENMEKTYASIGQQYNPESGAFQRELVLSAFTDRTNTALMAMSTEDKVSKFNTFSEINASWQKSFIRAAKALIEKLLNVKAFFDQYTAKVPKMRPRLFIVNACLEDVVEVNAIRQLTQYLESTNNIMDCKNAIWFGIVPNIMYAEGSDLQDIDAQTMQEMGYTGDFVTGESEPPNDITCLQQLMEAIKKYRIQTFFSFEAGDETTFSRFATHGVERYIEKAQPLDDPFSGYAQFVIPCLPNFTVIPRDRSKVVYGSRVSVVDRNGKEGVAFSADVEEQFKFWIYGVYVSAAFVAAGLVAAYQCPSYLETKYGRVLKDSPGVRFDIEAQENSSIVTTTFAKEIAGISNDDKAVLNRNNFGFIFSSDRANNITVFKARSMLNKEGSFISIFKETTISYVARMLRILSDDLKMEGIMKQYAPGGQIKKWELSNGYVNSILKVGDSIQPLHSEDGLGTIEITFGGMSEYIQLTITTE